MSGPPEGWFPDPTGRHQHRWWTGAAWAAAVADDGAQSFDPDGLAPDAPSEPRAEPTAEEHAEVLRACHAGAIGGDDPLTADVLVLWHRRSGLVDLNPTWSVHDGTGMWLGTFTRAQTGPMTNDVSWPLRGPDGVVLTVRPDQPTAVARITTHDGADRASIAREGGSSQRAVAVVDGMTVAGAFYAVGEVAIADATGETVGRLVPPPLKVRRRVGRRIGWDPALVSEQTAVGDPVTGRGVNAFALCWTNAVPEWFD